MLVIPERAISAEARATADEVALRLTHGTSTKPATGSHTSPIKPFIAKAAALMQVKGEPPPICASPAEAIAAADPHSAWQPPSAPDREAFEAMH